MSEKVSSTKKPELVEILKEIGENLDRVLTEEKEREYFENIVLNYGLIENLLKYNVFLKISWDQTAFDVDNSIDRKESLRKFEMARDYCTKLSFYQAGEMAVAINLIDCSLYDKISKIRKERNNIIHQYWLYKHKNDPKTLKMILKEVTGVSHELIKIFIKLFEEIGSTRVFDLSLFFT
ncbi:MAG: hypothetical protein NTY71_08430 [Methanoregula sp.]|nr:hypothetical protein [Methanoregula sp.]